MIRFVGFLLILLLLTTMAPPRVAAAFDEDVEAALNHQFKDKVLILLHPQEEKTLRFDRDGESLDSNPLRAWTVFAGIHITKVQLPPDKLHLEGKRVFFFFESGKLAQTEFEPSKDQFVNIEIKLDQPLHSPDEANAILSRVFALNKEDFVSSVPAYWREYISRHAQFDITRPGEIHFTMQDSQSTTELKSGEQDSPATHAEQADGAIFKNRQRRKAAKVHIHSSPQLFYCCSTRKLHRHYSGLCGHR